MPWSRQLHLLARHILGEMDQGPVSTSQRNCTGLLIILLFVPLLYFLQTAHGMLMGEKAQALCDSLIGQVLQGHKEAALQPP